MPAVISKLGDNKVAVRQANNKLLAVLMDVLQPGTILEGLSMALVHSNWKVREAAVNVFTQVLPSFTGSVWHAYVKSISCFFSTVDPSFCTLCNHMSSACFSNLLLLVPQIDDVQHPGSFGLPSQLLCHLSHLL